MSESDGKQREIPESEKILAQIEEAQQAKSSKAESTPDLAISPAQNDPEKGTNPTDKTEAAPQGQAVSQQMAPSDKKQDKPEVDIREWANKKGLKDADAAFRSLRELEQKFSKAQAALREQERNVPRGTQDYPQQGYAPQFQPQPQWQPQPNYYAPPPPYQDPLYKEKILEMEAAKRGWDKEDFKKVLELVDGVSDMKIRLLQNQHDAQYAELAKETRRNSELNELLKDPLFTNPEVQFEMHKVLEENPKAFTLEPSPYLYAFNTAQKRLARKYLQENNSGGERTALPVEPPRDSSRSSSPSFEKSPATQINEEFSKAKTSEEQLKILSRLGAITTL